MVGALSLPAIASSSSTARLLRPAPRPDPCSGRGRDTGHAVAQGGRGRWPGGTIRCSRTGAAGRLTPAATTRPAATAARLAAATATRPETGGAARGGTTASTAARKGRGPPHCPSPAVLTPAPGGGTIQSPPLELGRSPHNAHLHAQNEPSGRSVRVAGHPAARPQHPPPVVLVVQPPHVHQAPSCRRRSRRAWIPCFQASSETPRHEVSFVSQACADE